MWRARYWALKSWHSALMLAWRGVPLNPYVTWPDHDRSGLAVT